MATRESMAAAWLRARRVVIGGTIVAAGLAVAFPYRSWRAPVEAEALSIAPAIGMPGAPPTSAEGLRQRINEMQIRLQARPRDTGAAVLLAEALWRQARVASDGRTTARAAALLESVLADTPGYYEAYRMLGAVYLSQHRFQDALEAGRRARELRPDDAWNYGIIGDALIELGDYEQGFQAIQRMIEIRPGAAGYARVAYARELQGNLAGALDAMQMAAEATTPHDPEAQAWYASQLGELYLQIGNPSAAEREYSRACVIYPQYPLAMIGLGKIKAARDDVEGALALYSEQFKRTPTLELAARIGDLYLRQGNVAKAEYYYQVAEDLAGPPMLQTEPELALFLAEHDRNLPDAVRIAEALIATRDDIFTADALAWAYFKTGRLTEAKAASERALRTGTRDPRILSHAAEIGRALNRRHTP